MFVDIYQDLVELCKSKSDVDKATAMKAYLKGKFEYFGITSPERKLLVKSIKSRYNISFDENFWILIDALWKADQREMQYIAMDLMLPQVKKMDCSHICLLEKLVLSKSWWDTVDSLSTNMVGEIFRNNIDCRDLYVFKWIESENIWLHRVSLIFQLKYRLDTDWDIMQQAILTNDTSKEFFIRKAQGWALRQFGRYNPYEVKQFVDANPQLSGLTKREALKYISNDGSK